MTSRGSCDGILITRRTGDVALIISSIIEQIYSSGNTVAVWSGGLYKLLDIMSSHSIRILIGICESCPSNIASHSILLRRWEDHSSALSFFSLELQISL